MVLVGPLLDRIPLHLLQLVIGVLLLLSGMRWLRKVILRAVWQELDQPPSTGKLSASQGHHHGSGRREALPVPERNGSHGGKLHRTAPPNLCLWPTDASEQSWIRGEKKGLCSILARYHTWVRWQLHQIALAGSSPERSWGSQLFGWLPDR